MPSSTPGRTRGVPQHEGGAERERRPGDGRPQGAGGLPLEPRRLGSFQSAAPAEQIGGGTVTAAGNAMSMTPERTRSDG